MKKFILIILFLVITTTALGQQQDNILKFLGIPIDGTKEQMISNIQDKGFKYYKEQDLLVGDFNGKESAVGIYTFHGKVSRVIVIYGTYDEGISIRRAFNYLLDLFKKNNKYFWSDIHFIPDDENIPFEMMVNNKQYNATFYLRPPILNNLIDQVVQDTDPTDVNAMEYAIKQRISESLISEIKDSITGRVWLNIIRERASDTYALVIYYENLLNMPNGEDL